MKQRAFWHLAKVYKFACARHHAILLHAHLVALAKCEGISVRDQDRFLQKRARGPVSHRKRPAPSPDRSQQGLKRAPRRPAFSMIPHGAHAGAAESGDASDEGETVMLNPRESPALNTPFR